MLKKILKGVRQGNTISAKIITAGLECIFWKMNWKEMKGKLKLKLFKISESSNEFKEMLNNLNRESLYGHFKKWREIKYKFQCNILKKIIKLDEKLQEVQEYIYLGKVITLNKNHEN